MGILRALFLITLITFPLGQLARLQFGNNISVTLFDLSVLITGMWWLIAVAKNAEYRKGTLTKPIILFLLTILISLIGNSLRYSSLELFVSALYGIRWLLFACTYFVIGDLHESVRKKLPEWMVIVGGVVVLFGYVQYVFYRDLKNLYYLGWDEHLARMFSTFLDPNFFGAFLVLYFIFMLGMVSKVLTQPARDTFKVILYTTCTTLSFIGIFLTTSRSAMVMLAISLLTYLVLIKKVKYLILFAIFVVSIYVVASPFFYIENINPFRTASSFARVESGEHAIAIISENSVIGVGFNAYRYAQQEYGFRNTITPYPSHADSGTDTSMLFVFATTGLLGGIAYCYLVYRVLLLGKKEKTAIQTVLYASAVGLLVNSLFINSLFYPLIMYWVWLLAGLSDYT